THRSPGVLLREWQQRGALPRARRKALQGGVHRDGRSNGWPPGEHRTSDTHRPRARARADRRSAATGAGGGGRGPRTTSPGTAAYNLALGERRARAVRDYLVAHGVAADRITTVSYGEERPVCREHNEGCWSQNRRAAFVVKPK